jgi:capsular exopolysaccharide synthesis family protein
LRSSENELVNPKLILITSSLASEGKTQVASNLGISFSLAGFRTLIIDTDLRRPSIESNFSKILTDGVEKLKLDKGPIKGLTDGLQKNNFRALITKNVVKNLDVLTAGSRVANPAEILLQQNFYALLERLRSNYDYIILDSSPILPTSEPLTIASKMDFVIVVAKVDTTRVSYLKRTLDSLDIVGQKKIGMVLNMIPVGKHEEEYGYGYGLQYLYNYKYYRTGRSYSPQANYGATYAPTPYKPLEEDN